MKNITATYLTKDQNWQEESTIYWFEVVGLDNASGLEFWVAETYGIVDKTGHPDRVVDCDGCPVPDGDAVAECIRRNCVISEDMMLAK